MKHEPDINITKRKRGEQGGKEERWAKKGGERKYRCRADEGLRIDQVIALNI